MKTLQKAKETLSAATLMITVAANKMLSKRIVTVMDKQMTPSSGESTIMTM